MEEGRHLIIIGIFGCIIYVIADLFYAFKGKNDSNKSFGIMIKVAYLKISNWRMSLSIILGFFGTLLFYMGFHQMYKVLKHRLVEANNKIYIKLFRISYITGTVAWTYFHSMFMNVGFVFKFIFENYGDMEIAANIAKKIIYYNTIPMVVSFIVCDLGFLLLL